MSDSSMTDRRMDSGLLSRRTVKNALTSVRGLYGKLRREVARGYDKIDRQNRINEMGVKLTSARMQLDEEELWNLRNENLENELKELAMKIN